MEKVLWGLKGVLVGVDQCLRGISQSAINKLPKSSFISVSCTHISFGAFLVWLWHFVFVVCLACIAWVSLTCVMMQHVAGLKLKNLVWLQWCGSHVRGNHEVTSVEV